MITAEQAAKLHDLIENLLGAQSAVDDALFCDGNQAEAEACFTRAETELNSFIYEITKPA